MLFDEVKIRHKYCFINIKFTPISRFIQFLCVAIFPEYEIQIVILVEEWLYEFIRDRVLLNICI